MLRVLQGLQEFGKPASFVFGQPCEEQASAIGVAMIFSGSRNLPIMNEQLAFDIETFSEGHMCRFGSSC